MAMNFNVEPYYDDFDEAKNFHQILFKPGYAVQTRELNQLQSILKNQIEKFGNHVFQQGSVVIPGNSLSDLAVPYIKVESTYLSDSIDINNFIDKVIVGATSGLEAVVKKVASATLTDKTTFYLSYTMGSSTGAVNFTDGENVTLKDNSSIGATLISSSATGVGSLAYINAGVYYVNGTFVSVLPQSIIISKYDSVPSCKVSLKIIEEFLTYADDESLLDNATGAYNYAAPGADRYKISLELVSLSLTEPVTDNYVDLMQFVDGELVEFSRYPKYSELEKSLARRTFDESGNYVVNGLSPVIKEHLKSGSNGGVYSDGDISKLVVDVSAGKSYINGFEVEHISSTKVVIDKARTIDHIKDTNIVLRPSFGEYLIISNIVGYFSVYNHDTITLYNDNDPANGSATIIGTAKVSGIDYLIGDITSSAIYKLWVTDITLVNGYTLNSVGGIRYGSYSAYALTKYSAPVTSKAYTVGEVVNNSGSTRTATVKYWDATSGTLYAYKHDHTKDTPNVGELLTGASSTTSSAVLSKTTLVSVGQTGLIFRLPSSVPYSLKDPDTSAWNLSYTVQKELSITTNGSGGGSVSVGSGETISPIEAGTFQAIGTSGIVQNALFSLNIAGTTLTITGGPVSSVVKVYTNVLKTNVASKTKTLTTYSQVISSPTSSMTLDKTDIISITSIVDSVGDITANYTLWNGQSDYSYNRGTITLNSGKSAPSGSITVTYKYYEQSIAGDFFCVDSYPTGILDTYTYYNSYSTGQLYDLPTCLDFRPSVGADGTYTGTNSRRNDLVVADTTFNSTFQYYVPRIDLLVMSKTGKISIITGTPSNNPVSPVETEGLFSINSMFIPAYTKSSIDVSVKRLAVERFTMSDIQKISNQVTRVENFATLNASELSVTTQNIKDAATGLDMFKTGYLVEQFNQPLTVARTTASDYAATFVGNVVTCSMESLMCNLTYLGSSSNVVNKSGYLMLPYTETVFASQTLSSRTTNLNPFLMISWSGILDINPKSDDWTEIRDLPVIFESKTETNIVYNYISCPPLPPLPATTYGGLYGTVIGRAGEKAGIDYWVSTGEANTKASFNASANATYNSYGQGAYVNSDSSKSDTNTGMQILKNNPLSAEALANERYLSTTTSYSYGAGRSIVATTVAIDFEGRTTTTTTPRPA